MEQISPAEIVDLIEAADYPSARVALISRRTQAEVAVATCDVMAKLLLMADGANETPEAVLAWLRDICAGSQVGDTRHYYHQGVPVPY